MAAAPTFDPQRPMAPTALGKWAAYAREFLLAAGRGGAEPVLLDVVGGREGAAFLPTAWIAHLEPLLFGSQTQIEVAAAKPASSAPSLDDILGALEDDPHGGPPSGSHYPKQADAYRLLGELHATAAARPHETGFSYGAVFLEGFDSSGRTVSAPLYSLPVDVALAPDGSSFRITTSTATAQLQLGLIAHVMPDAYPLMAADLQELAELPLPVDRDAIHQLIEVLRTFSNHIDVPRELLGQFARWDMIEEPSAAPRLVRPGQYRLTRVAGLHLVARDGRVLPRELSLLSKQAAHLEGSVAHRLSQSHTASNPFLVEPATSTSEYVFPASSEQAAAARAVRENDLLHVQAPPGSGKSQTIVNIACQWVLEGRKVLIVSPTRANLCNLAERYFQPLGLPFLPATVSQAAGRGIASSSDFQRQLEAASANAGKSATAADLATHSAHLRERAAEVDAQMAACLSQHAQPWRDTGLTRTQLAAEYHEHDSLDAVPDGPPLAWGQQDAVATQLISALELAASAREKGLDPGEILGVRRATTGTDLRADLVRLGDVLNHRSGPPPAEPAEPLPPLAHLEHRSHAEIANIREFLDKQLKRLDNLYAEPLCQQTLAATQGRPAEACEEDLRALRNFRRALPELSKVEERAKSCPGDGVSPLELTRALDAIEKQQIGEQVRPGELAAAKDILTRAVGSKEAAKQLNLHAIKARVQANRLRVALGEARHKRLSALPVPEVPWPLDAAAERRMTGACLAIDQALEERIGTTRAVAAASDWIDVELLLEPARCTAVDRSLAAIESTHKVAASLAEARQLSRELQLAERPGMMRELAVAVEEGDRDRATTVYAKLTESWSDDSDLRQLAQLLKGPLAAHKDWLGALLEASATAAEVRAQVRARAVRAALAESFSEPEPDTANLAAKARQLESQARQTARYQLEAALNERAAQAWEDAPRRRYLERFTQSSGSWRATLEKASAAKDAPAAFSELLSVLPCWLATPEDVAGALPVDPALFDLVLLDDASLLSPARAIPALARAPRAAVFGDEHQIGPAECKSVPAANNEALLHRAGLAETDFADCGMRSLFDLTRGRASAALALTNHYRCHDDIAAFANERFYASQWSVLSSGAGVFLRPPRKLVVVEEAEDDPAAQVNDREAEAVVHAIQKLSAHPRYEGLRIGVCSLFETQAEDIRHKLEGAIAPRVRERLALRCGTPRDWVGDECDVMLLSFRFAANSHMRVLDPFDGLEGSRQMGVATTRARVQLVCFVSCSPRRFPRGVVREFLEHVEEQREASFDHEGAPTEFERALGEHFIDKGFRVDYRVLLGGATVDLVVRSPEGQAVAIEADGDRIDDLPTPMQIAQRRQLEAAGWTFLRVYAPAFYVDPEAALNHIWRHLRTN